MHRNVRGKLLNIDRLSPKGRCFKDNFCDESLVAWLHFHQRCHWPLHLLKPPSPPVLVMSSAGTVVLVSPAAHSGPLIPICELLDFLYWRFDLWLRMWHCYFNRVVSRRTYWGFPKSCDFKPWHTWHFYGQYLLRNLMLGVYWNHCEVV